MKFRGIKPFLKGQNVEDFLSSSLRADLIELIDGLQRLNVTENFESFEYEGTIQPGTETEIRNQLSTIPSGRFIVRHVGDPGIVDGDADWSQDFVYLKNAGTSAATVKVIFFK